MEIASSVFSIIICISFLGMAFSVKKYFKHRGLTKKWLVMPKKSKRWFKIWKILSITFAILFILTVISFTTIISV